MKSILIHLSLLVFLSSFSAYAQDRVKYGSNNGKYVTIMNTRIYYEEYGKGMPLLLLHGGFGTIADFEKCIDQLSKKYKVIAADSPGHGRSSMPDSLTYPNLAKHFSKMIDALKLDSVYVMGWSDGGVVALTLAADRPDKVKKVIATGANTRADGQLQEAIDFINGMSVSGAEAAKDQDEFVGNWIRTYQNLSGSKDSWKIYIDKIKPLWLTEVYIPEKKLNGISIPVLLVFGDKDVIKLDHAMETYRLIPKSQFCILPNTTHHVYAEKPTLINTIAIDFFNE